MQRVRQLLVNNGGKFARRTSAAMPSAICSTITISRRWYALPAVADPFLSGSSSTYIEDMYNAWLKDPNTVHAVGFK